MSNTGLNKNANVSETGLILVGGTFTSVANAGGWADRANAINSIGSGSLAVGRTFDASEAEIVAWENGDWAGGVATGSTAIIYASGGDHTDAQDARGGSFAFGNVKMDGVIKTTRPGSFALGFAHGFGDDTDPVWGDAAVVGALSACGIGSFALGCADGGRIMTKGYGAFAMGYTSAIYGSTTADFEAYINAEGTGSACFGVANSSFGDYSTDSYPAKIHTKGPGSLAIGYASVNATEMDENLSTGYGKDAHIYTHADAAGGFAMGCAIGGAAHGKITVKKSGGFAMGYSLNSQIEAGGAGSFAGGYSSATTYGSTNKNFKIVTGPTGLGAIAFGHALNSFIQASKSGAVALGFADEMNITADGKGAFAAGWASNNQVKASGDNTVQFGEGSNEIDDSVACGSTFRFRNIGGNAHPGNSVLRNGDMWVKDNYVYVRSNSANVKIS
jgi:hypothetical protein